jgi:hypothetical protein
MREFCRRACLAPDLGRLSGSDFVRLMVWTCCGQCERLEAQGEENVSVGATDSLCKPLEEAGRNVLELERFANAVLFGQASFAETAVARVCWEAVADMRRIALAVGTRNETSVLLLVEETRLVRLLSFFVAVVVHVLFYADSSETRLACAACEGTEICCNTC